MIVFSYLKTTLKNQAFYDDSFLINNGVMNRDS